MHRFGMPPKSSRKESGLQELAAGIHGQIPCQELSVADDTENRWKLGHRIPTGFGVVGSEAKNGYAGIRVPLGRCFGMRLPVEVLVLGCGCRSGLGRDAVTRRDMRNPWHIPAPSPGARTWPSDGCFGVLESWNAPTGHRIPAQGATP